MKVGYLGPEGTNSEEAGFLYVKKLKQKADIIPYSTFFDLITAVNKKMIDEAVLPIENSIEGTIGIVTDMLVKDVDLKIKQEFVLPIYHYLIAQKGIRLKEVTDVISNPPVLDQSRDFLKKNLPHAKLHLAYSSADAVRQVAISLGEKIIAHGKVKGHVFAAIGTKASAKLYNLNIIASQINAKDNQTRFVVLAGSDHPRTGKDKTSIVFSIAKDRPGGLHDVLAEIADKDINLTKIESRPSKKSLGDYYFFADMQGHRTDLDVQVVLKNLRRKTSFFKLLGSYPAYRQAGLKGR
ncbi:MAG: prephenate dehydratase [Candidatus Margulisbacteria bacterium]|nr:prephenate dehydratase [Candidatus Margulisiibacteriota bacterium]MBU1616838.1 prephenate dehydratase [Candidatus Margulisiibacteriota bacterium]